MVGWLTALLNQVRGVGLISAGGVALLPEGVAALAVLALVCVLACVGFLVVSRITRLSALWGGALAGSVLLVAGAVSCAYLATTPFAAVAENDAARVVTGPSLLLLPTAIRSLLSAGIVMLLAAVLPFPRTRWCLLALGGLLIATLVTPNGYTAWLQSVPLALLVAGLVAHLTRPRSTPVAQPLSSERSSASAASRPAV